jgi:hypothetical protein
VEFLACADPGARAPIGVSGKSHISFTHNPIFVSAGVYGTSAQYLMSKPQIEPAPLGWANSALPLTLGF